MPAPAAASSDNDPATLASVPPVPRYPALFARACARLQPQHLPQRLPGRPAICSRLMSARVPSRWRRTTMDLEGGCFCGAIRYKVEGPPLDAGYCHCRMCQRTTAAPAVRGRPGPEPDSPGWGRSPGRCARPSTAGAGSAGNAGRTWCSRLPTSRARSTSAPSRSTCRKPFARIPHLDTQPAQLVRDRRHPAALSGRRPRRRPAADREDGTG